MINQEHCCWNIGPITFCAVRENSHGWLINGEINNVEIMNEIYLKGTYDEVLNYTKTWAREYGESIIKAAEGEGQ